MKHLIAFTGFAALLAAVLTGCGAAGSGATSSPPPTSNPMPRASVSIVYPIQTGIGSKDHASHACPAGAACTYASVGTSAEGAETFEPVVHWHLTCSPAGGTYHDPVAACRALADLRHRIKIRHQICMCPMILTRAPSKISGTVDGTPVMLGLSACALCGLGHAAEEDAKTLMPGVFGS
jgi:hypothetical protein